MTTIDTDIHVGDAGTTFLIVIKDNGSPVDLSSGSPLNNYIVFRKPDTTTASYPAGFDTTGVDGKIKYITSGSDIINQSGTWRIGAIVTTACGIWTATAVEFSVKDQFTLSDI